jgi:hypothetical protein
MIRVAGGAGLSIDARCVESDTWPSPPQWAASLTIQHNCGCAAKSMPDLYNDPLLSKWQQGNPFDRCFIS